MGKVAIIPEGTRSQPGTLIGVGPGLCRRWTSEKPDYKKFVKRGGRDYTLLPSYREDIRVEEAVAWEAMKRAEDAYSALQRT